MQVRGAEAQGEQAVEAGLVVSVHVPEPAELGVAEPSVELDDDPEVGVADVAHRS